VLGEKDFKKLKGVIQANLTMILHIFMAPLQILKKVNWENTNNLSCFY